MRYKVHRALTMIAMLAGMPPEPGKPFGDAAKDLDINTAARMAGRARRAAKRSGYSVFGGGPVLATAQGLSLAGLVAFSAKVHRGRQTHPGKRGKRARP